MRIAAPSLPSLPSRLRSCSSSGAYWRSMPSFITKPPAQRITPRLART